jgi:predicted PurR-regulated permease PerM
MQQFNNLTISILTIIKILAVLLALGFLYLIRDVLVLLFVAIIFAAAISPWIDFFQKRKIPRALGLIFIYLLLFSILTLTVGLLIPPITTQINQLANNFPNYYQKVTAFFAPWQKSLGPAESVQEILKSWGLGLGKMTANIFSTVMDVFGGFLSFLAILVLIFYMTVKERGMQRFLEQVLPKKHQERITSLITRVQEKMGLWLRGQLILCLIIGILSYLGLSILGVNYALVLALVAGITEIVPFVGPIIGGILAVLLAFVQSPSKAFFVIILYVIIQQLENQIIVPRVMKRAVGLNPIITIIAILIGARLAGILGALIAVPVATAFLVFVRNYISQQLTVNNK